MAAKNATQGIKLGLAELAKRVPPNQALKFKDFQAKHFEYQSRVRKQPEKLPSIDWDFYRRNVRAEHVKWVDEFEQKYKSVSDCFDARSKQDKSKYFMDLDKMREQVQGEVKKYIAESNERIKALEAEYERIKALKPYEEMTAEEYSELLPDKSMFKYKGEPSFWPHTPEEQGAGPSFKGGHDHHNGHNGQGGTDPKPSKKSGGSNDGSGNSSNGGKVASSEKPETKVKADDEKSNAAKSKTESDKVVQAINAAVIIQKIKEEDTTKPRSDYKSNKRPDDITAADLSEKINEISKCATKKQEEVIELTTYNIVNINECPDESEVLSEKNNFQAFTPEYDIKDQEEDDGDINNNNAQEVALKK